LDELLHILRSKPQQLAELYCLKPWLFPGSVISHPAWGNGKPLGNLCGCEERAVPRRMVLLGRSVQTGFSFLHGRIMAVIPKSMVRLPESFSAGGVLNAENKGLHLIRGFETAKS
jgi:hypothetical protein